MPLVGDELAGYRLQEPIGRGGMGTVYRAEHIALSRVVAVKVMNQAVAADDRFRVRFKREARLAAALEHPNIVPVYDAGESGEHLYIAMRYIDGTDLAALIARGRLEPERVVGVVEQVAAALDAAHRRGLIHRDVKPANVLLRSDPDDPASAPHVYLTDFGITRETEATQDLTATGAFIGSVQYAAPEQIETGAATPATDIYALGCLTYEALTGEPPFRRDHDVATLWAHVNDAVEPLSTQIDGVSPELEAAVLRALEKDPADRWPTCSAFAAALRAGLSAEDATIVDAPAPRAPAPAPARAPVPAPAAPDEPTVAARTSRRTWLRVAGVAAVLAASVAVGVAVAGGGDGAATTAVASPAVRLTLPESAKPRSSTSLPDLPGLQFAGPVAAAQVGDSLVRAGRLENPGRAPNPLGTSFTGNDSQRSLVRLPAGEALRFDQRRAGGLRRTFALATGPKDWVVLSCEAPQVASAEDCDTAAAGLKLRGAAAVPLSPDKAFAASLAAERGALARARERQLPRIRTGSAARRAAAARALAGAHRSAARALAGAKPPVVARAATAQERAALERVGSDFAALASAATAKDRAAFNRARDRLSAGEESLRRAQAALTALGYGG